MPHPAGLLISPPQPAKYVRCAYRHCHAHHAPRSVSIDRNHLLTSAAQICASLAPLSARVSE